MHKRVNVCHRFDEVFFLPHFPLFITIDIYKVIGLGKWLTWLELQSECGRMGRR